MIRAVVMGAGRVGSLIARDLAASSDVAVVATDLREEALRPLADDGIAVRAADLTEVGTLRELVSDADVAVGAVPGSMGYGLLERLIEAGTPVVDISFSPEDPRDLDGIARDRGVPAVVDCGVAPGLSNLMVGLSAGAMDRIDSVRILVGGLPARPEEPWGYRAVFSPADVIEEYVRPCRMRVDGEDVVVDALSGLERVELEEVGVLEAFHTDGLRSLLDTIDAPTMAEKTLRWPGHAAKARALRDSGFFDESPVRVGGVEVAPRELAVTLLTETWALEEAEEELTILIVELAGVREGNPARETWRLLDRTDAATGDTSMARTTGFPAAQAARLLATGRWNRPGVHPPEALAAEPEVAESILGAVRERGVSIRREGAGRASETGVVEGA
ncbi:MAG: saccharopine dehydrogenase C-terminal domain-containing protein [Gemmatimonadota bacterium]|nr:saccharopine dehydrogenase C-terminal domain-containing protein [Gemmatimonadota bacterium]